jgi:hypothetical protein
MKIYYDLHYFKTQSHILCGAYFIVRLLQSF